MCVEGVWTRDSGALRRKEAAWKEVLVARDEDAKRSIEPYRIK